VPLTARHLFWTLIRVKSQAKAFIAIYCCLPIFFTSFWSERNDLYHHPWQDFSQAFSLDQAWNHHGLWETWHRHLPGNLFRSARLGWEVEGHLSVRRTSETNVVLLIGFSSLRIFAGITFTGIGSVWLLEETKDRSLEELSREKWRDVIYGRSISHTRFAVLTLRQVSPDSSCGMAWLIDKSFGASRQLHKALRFHFF
jgi:hypothetical protein